MSASIEHEIRRARTGDRQAQEQLFARLRPRIAKWAERMLDGDLAARVRPSDLVQSALLDALTSMPTFQGTTERDLAAWIQRILEHTIQDRRRYHRRDRRRIDQERGLASAVDAILDPGPSPSSRVASIEELSLVSQGLRLLADDHREIIMRCLVRGQSHREAALALDRSEGACRVLLARARAALALELDRLRGAT